MLKSHSLQFLNDLKQNNNREWFLDNKKRYEAYKADYQQLIAAFLDALKPHDATLANLEVKNCSFRINRDIRFSNDKTPYKTHLSIWISSGSKNANRAGYYIHIDTHESFIAGGLYCPEANDLKKIRKEIAFFYEDLDTVLQEENFKKVFNNFDRNEKNTLKNPPRGYEKEHPAIEYLKLKSFETSQKIDTNSVLQPDFVTKTAKKLLLLQPLNTFINTALSTEE